MKKEQETKEDKNEEEEQHFAMGKSELRNQVINATNSKNPFFFSFM